MEQEQFAANIGMLRRTVQTIAGPRDFDLVFARVGCLRLGALPEASFSAAAALHPGAESIEITMRLETPEPVRLHFASSQEYDVVLRDSEGAVIWRWSDGRAFLPARQERVVAGSWSTTVHIPAPVSVEPGPRAYTVEAWLTTEPGSPRYAVTLPLTFSPGDITPAER